MANSRAAAKQNDGFQKGKTHGRSAQNILEKAESHEGYLVGESRISRNPSSDRDVKRGSATFGRSGSRMLPIADVCDFAYGVADI